MLQNTFVHIPGVGYRTELNLWQSGILSWEDYLRDFHKVRLLGRKKDRIAACIMDSRYHLTKNNHRFFVSGLPRREVWRTYPEFKNSVAFLDIETTGLDVSDEITMVGIYDGNQVKTLIKEVNLDELENELSKYSVLVTYNGACFDLPFIKLHFPDAALDQLHIDLRYPLKRLGYSGGLKHIERSLNIRRSEETKNLDGFDAVRLWHEHRRGSKKSLELLIKYNSEDIVNLKKLMEFVYSRLKKGLLGNFMVEEALEG
jgi:uncharacterized protein YprB with RNaseH-like and TPR domain